MRKQKMTLQEWADWVDKVEQKQWVDMVLNQISSARIEVLLHHFFITVPLPLKDVHRWKLVSMWY